MRIINRLLAFVLGVALVTVVGVALVEVAWAVSGRGPVVVPWQRWQAALVRRRWDDPELVAIAVGLVLVGLVLLIIELVPRRPLQLPLQSPQSRRVSIDRRGLQERLRRVVLGDTDVIAASVRVRRRAKVRAHVHADTDRRACRARLQASVTGAVDQLGLAERLRTQIALSRTTERVR